MQSEAMREALREPDAIKRLINVFELLHPMRLSDLRHGFVDTVKLVEEARVLLDHARHSESISQ